MEAMRLGTLPIVAPTGGLKDTVEARKIGQLNERPVVTWVLVGFSHHQEALSSFFGDPKRPSLSTGKGRWR